MNTEGMQHLTEAVHWADMNIVDARSKFPAVIERAEMTVDAGRKKF